MVQRNNKKERTWNCSRKRKKKEAYTHDGAKKNWTRIKKGKTEGGRLNRKKWKKKQITKWNKYEKREAKKKEKNT